MPQADRTAMTLEPVRLNSDELYHILRTRLFKNLPTETQIRQIAQSYADALHKARQMDMTSESPEEMAAQILTSYPFHPGIRDLYARFRENPGFQQTRGLIRLMRLVAANLWETDLADQKYLIYAEDVASITNRSAQRSAKSTAPSTTPLPTILPPKELHRPKNWIENMTVEMQPQPLVCS